LCACKDNDGNRDNKNTNFVAHTHLLNRVVKKEKLYAQRGFTQLVAFITFFKRKSTIALAFLGGYDVAQWRGMKGVKKGPSLVFGYCACSARVRRQTFFDKQACCVVDS
jgi:hypothetical protein